LMDGLAILASSDATFVLNVDLRCAAKLLHPALKLPRLTL
jgi:hypothetical protein